MDKFSPLVSINHPITAKRLQVIIISPTIILFLQYSCLRFTIYIIMACSRNLTYTGFDIHFSVFYSKLVRCSVCVYLQLFAAVLMSCLRYLCLLAHSNVHHILCCFSSSCVPYVSNFSGFYIFDCPFGIL